VTNDNRIVGMTVNERLAHFSLFDDFDSAVESRDLSAVIAVLQRAKLSDEQARETTAAILSNPNYYGLR